MKKSLVVLVALCCIVASRVEAAPIVYTASLSGAIEFPSNASPGSGFTTVTYDPVAHTLRVEATFSDLLGTTTAAHIHCCTVPPPFNFAATAGIATQTPSFSGFPLGVTSGSYDNTFDLTLASSWRAAFITANGGTPAGAEVALATGLDASTAYLNIHTSTFGGGEIRGFLAQVPEPVTLLLVGLGAAAVGVRRRRRA